MSTSPKSRGWIKTRTTLRTTGPRGGVSALLRRGGPPPQRSTPVDQPAQMKTIHPPNPFAESAKRRRAAWLRSMGGQYRSPPPTRLSPEQEAMIDFERARAEIVSNPPTDVLPF